VVNYRAEESLPGIVNPMPRAPKACRNAMRQGEAIRIGRLHRVALDLVRNRRRSAIAWRARRSPDQNSR